jgi:hypothetical protein
MIVLIPYLEYIREIINYNITLIPLTIILVDISSSDICDKDREKRDDVRSISRMNTTDLDWFRPSSGVIAARPSFVMLRYKIRCP